MNNKDVYIESQNLSNKNNKFNNYKRYCLHALGIVLLFLIVFICVINVFMSYDFSVKRYTYINILEIIVVSFTLFTNMLYFMCVYKKFVSFICKYYALIESNVYIKYINSY